jgi:hypothetical protein
MRGGAGHPAFDAVGAAEGWMAQSRPFALGGADVIIAALQSRMIHGPWRQQF